MNDEEIRKCADLLDEMAVAIGNIPEATSETAAACMQFQLTRSYLVEYLVHRSRGSAPSDALEGAANGELLLTESQKLLSKILLSRPKQ